MFLPIMIIINLYFFICFVHETICTANSPMFSISSVFSLGLLLAHSSCLLTSWTSTRWFIFGSLKSALALVSLIADWVYLVFCWDICEYEGVWVTSVASENLCSPRYLLFELLAPEVFVWSVWLGTWLSVKIDMLRLFERWCSFSFNTLGDLSWVLS